MVQKNKKTMIKEKGKEICQRVLDTNRDDDKYDFYVEVQYDVYLICIKIKRQISGYSSGKS